MIEPTAHTLVSTRLKLNWYRWGSPDAPLLLLIHGGRDHARTWDHLADRFRDRWQVVAPDLRGHGRSDWADGGAYEPNDFVYDLHRLTVTLGVSAERPATILGHSMGGSVAIRWTALYPERVRRLIAIEGLGLMPEAEEKAARQPFIESLREWIGRRERRETKGLPVYPTVEAAIARMLEVNPRFPPALARHLTEHGLLPVGGGYTFAYDPLILAWNVRQTLKDEQHALWTEITCPTLLMVGADSWASNPAKDGRAAQFRDARVIEFERAGHWLQFDRFEDFAAEVAAFID